MFQAVFRAEFLKGAFFRPVTHQAESPVREAGFQQRPRFQHAGDPFLVGFQPSDKENLLFLEGRIIAEFRVFHGNGVGNRQKFSGIFQSGDVPESLVETV